MGKVKKLSEYQIKDMSEEELRLTVEQAQKDGASEVVKMIVETAAIFWGFGFFDD